MSVFAPLIAAGVFAATLSSALGSFLGAPRILQAMGQDRLMPVMTYFGKGEGAANEPSRATVLTCVIAVGVIWAGDLNAVAEVISMFFLIAYGMINLSAFHPKNWRPILVSLMQNPLAETHLIRIGALIESHCGLYTVAQIAEHPRSSVADKIKIRNADQTELRRLLEANNITAFSEVVAVDEYHSGLVTFLQSYSIGGLRPNTLMTMVPPPIAAEEQTRFVDTIKVPATFDFNLLVLKPGDMAPDKKQRVIDLWWRGENNGSLMALLAHLVRQDKNWSNAQLRVLRIVRSAEEESSAKKHLTDLIEQIRISASVHIIHSDGSPAEIIRSHSAPTADLVFLGMNAPTADEVERFLDLMTPLLITLPTTLLVWSNGEADVFA